MTTVVKKATPAVIAVLRQATALWPKRKKTSDGLLPSLAHQRMNPNSDHNSGLAVDLTHDPDNGVDCNDIFEKLKTDPRVDYLIFNKKIWNSSKAKLGNRPYTGINPHNKHLHISVKADKSDDTSPWFKWINQPKIINQVLAVLQPSPTKKVSDIVEPRPKGCTCCHVHPR